MISKKTVFLSSVSALLLLVGGAMASCTCTYWLYQPRTPKALRGK